LFANLKKIPIICTDLILKLNMIEELKNDLKFDFSRQTSCDSNFTEMILKLQSALHKK